jgi:pantoate--beta-alanine ligase
MNVCTTFEDARGRVSGRVGLVPTMGYLHEGHLRLVETAAGENDATIVTVFVNPMQFDDDTDLDGYPRDLERDLGLAARAGADVVVAPSVTYVYPEDHRTTVTVAGVTDAMEGHHRPGHFAGVATVVAKLFAGLRPDTAYFGRKDAQQLAVIAAMARDLSFPVDVKGVPVVREVDGLALSSRNVRLSPDARRAASTLSAGLMAAADLIEDGSSDVAAILAAARSPMEADPLVRIDYVELADARSASPTRTLGGKQFIAVAAVVDGVRLIDSLTILDGDVDRGEVLPSSSILYGGT